jgi:hypothetical protein
LLEPGGSGDPALARQVVERLAHLGVPARVLDGVRAAPAAGAGVWVAAAGLDDLLSANGLGRTTTAVLLVVRTGHTHRSALVDASTLLRGSGISIPGVLVL